MKLTVSEYDIIWLGGKVTGLEVMEERARILLSGDTNLKGLDTNHPDHPVRHSIYTRRWKIPHRSRMDRLRVALYKKLGAGLLDLRKLREIFDREYDRQLPWGTHWKHEAIWLSRHPNLGGLPDRQDLRRL